MPKGSPLIFFTRPVSGVLMAVLILLIALQILVLVKKKRKQVDPLRGD